MEEINEELKDDNNFWFKYAKLDVELFANKNLNKTDCFVFAIIELKDSTKKHCWASNEYFAKLLNVSITTISTSITNLKKHGYVEDVMFDGRKRTIKIKDDWKKTHNHLLLEMIDAQESFNRKKQPLKSLKSSDVNEDFKDTLSQPLKSLKSSIKDPLKDIIKDHNQNIKEESSSSSKKEEEKSCAKNAQLSSRLSPKGFPSKPLHKLHRRSQTLIEWSKAYLITKHLSVAPSPSQEQRTLSQLPPRPVDRQKMKKGLKLKEEIIVLQEKAKRRIVKQKKEKRILKTTPQITPAMQYILDHWDAMELQPTMQITSKVYRDGLIKLSTLLHGKPSNMNDDEKLLLNNEFFIRQYEPEEIKDSITRFALAAKSDKYEPPDKRKLKKVNLNNFITSGYPKIYSYFQTYLNQYMPKPLYQTKESKYPEIVARLKRRYFHDILGAIAPSKLSPQDENAFIDASNKLMEYWKTNGRKMHGSFTSMEKADLLFEAVKNSAMSNLAIITPGWFCSENTFTKRLPAWLQHERITENGADDGGCGYTTASYQQEESSPVELQEESIQPTSSVFDIIPRRREKFKPVETEDDEITEDWQTRAARAKTKLLETNQNIMCEKF